MILPDGADSAAGRDTKPKAADEVRHLAQDEELIFNIHNEELPPDLYYEELRGAFASTFPGYTVQAREHALALCDQTTTPPSPCSCRPCPE